MKLRQVKLAESCRGPSPLEGAAKRRLVLVIIKVFEQ